MYNPFEHKTFKHPFNIDDVKVDINPANGGLCSYFKYDRKTFFADLTTLPGMQITECMIFNARNKQVTDWHELYCNRGRAVTDDNLRLCILEFIEQYDNGL